MRTSCQSQGAEPARRQVKEKGSCRVFTFSMTSCATGPPWPLTFHRDPGCGVRSEHFALVDTIFDREKDKLPENRPGVLDGGAFIVTPPIRKIFGEKSAGPGPVPPLDFL